MLFTYSFLMTFIIASAACDRKSRSLALVARVLSRDTTFPYQDPFRRELEEMILKIKLFGHSLGAFFVVLTVGIFLVFEKKLV